MFSYVPDGKVCFQMFLRDLLKQCRRDVQVTEEQLITYADTMVCNSCMREGGGERWRETTRERERASETHTHTHARTHARTYTHTHN